jgi:hypothetical protein
MAETLGSLFDRLTIVKLKQWHSEEPARLESLAVQERQLQAEINEFIAAALAGHIPHDRLTFAANKVFKADGHVVPGVQGSIGEVMAQLATVNSHLWHEQEKVYQFESIPPDQKDNVVKQLALLNLERNNCIDHIDREFRTLIEQRQRR